MRICPKCGEEIQEQFDSCWKCAGPLESNEMVSKARRLRPWDYFLAILMAVASPALADVLHSALVVMRGTRLHNVEIDRIGTEGFWIFLGLRAVITFFVLWRLFRSPDPFWRWMFWLGTFFVWFCLDIKWEYALKGW